MNTQFEKIYVISLITNKSRQEFMKKQMNELGLDFEFIYGIDYSNLTTDSLNNTFIKSPELFGSMPRTKTTDLTCYGCTLGHYQAVLQAYEFGYNNVLILEDDICFIRDKNIIENYLNNIPKEADFVTWDPRFIHLSEGKNETDIIRLEIKNRFETYYFRCSNSYEYLCGAMMYGIMNRKSMKLYLNNQRKNLYMSDHVKDFFRQPSVKRYVAKKCIIIDQYNYAFNFSQEVPEYTNNYKIIDRSINISMFNKPKEYLITNLNSMNGLQDLYDKKIKNKNNEY